MPSFLLGVGFGGFVDGILMHQVLHWHHLLSDTGENPMNTVRGLEDNTRADGVFHVVTWLIVFAGVTLAVRAWQHGDLAPSWRSHFGMLLVGWGVFNLVDGLLNHQILGLHHVRDDLGGPIGWDLGFLAAAVVLVALGLLLGRSGEPVRRLARP